MSLKAFISNFHALTSKYLGVEYKSPQKYISATFAEGGKAYLDTAPKWLGTVVSSATIDAGAVHTTSILKITGHSIKKFDVLRFVTPPFEQVDVQVIEIPDANTVILGNALPTTPAGSESYSHLRPVSPVSSLSGALQITPAAISIIDQVDDVGGHPIFDASVTAIPRRSVNAVSIVASLAGNATKIQVPQDIGAFMALYSDAARTNRICVLPLTPDESIEVSIAAGTQIFIGSIDPSDTDITSGLIAINFIG